MTIRAELSVGSTVSPSQVADAVAGAIGNEDAEPMTRFERIKRGERHNEVWREITVEKIEGREETPVATRNIRRRR